MHKFIFAVTVFYLLTIFVAVFAQYEPCTNTTGYYWRDFYGEMPDDAYVGARDENETLVYIAQTMYENKLLPAKVYQGTNVAHFQYEGAKIATDNLKILCSNDPGGFQWIETKTNEVPLLSGRYLVQGGYEPPTKLYIGRALIEGETSIGKVLVTPVEGHYRGLLTVKNGISYEPHVFEVLEWNSQLNRDILSIFDIDYRSGRK